MQVPDSADELLALLQRETHGRASGAIAVDSEPREADRARALELYRQDLEPARTHR